MTDIAPPPLKPVKPLNMQPLKNWGGRSFWLKQLHQWHWVSASICLIGMILFAVTGITLNHAADIEAKPKVVSRTLELPADILAQIAVRDGEAEKAVLPEAITGFLRRELGVDISGQMGDWSADEIYVALPRPGGDGWVNIDRAAGEVEWEETSRGWISYLNDLHKGRNTGEGWSWFLDIFAVGCLVFCGTGLVLLQFHARHRPATWPMVGLGVVAPLILILLFIH